MDDQVTGTVIERAQEERHVMLAQARETLTLILTILNHRLLVVMALIFNALLCAYVIAQPDWMKICAEGLFAVASFALVRFKE